MAKKTGKGFDPTKLTALLERGRIETRGPVQTTTTTPALSEPTRSIAPRVTSKASPVDGSEIDQNDSQNLGKRKIGTTITNTNTITLTVSPELKMALHRYSLDLREKHPTISAHKTRISGAAENLMRKALGMEALFE